MKSPIVEITLFVLILLSVLTWTVAIIKIRSGNKLAKQNKAFMEAFWDASNWAAGRAVVDSAQGTIAELAKAAFAVYDDYVKGPKTLKNAGDVDKVLERPMRQAIQNILRTRERGLSELASIGSTAPFVGLFGTVWGIMRALEEIGGTGQASIDIVAGPIGEALVATAIGIAAALPAVLFYNYFVRKIQIEQTQLDGFMDDYLRLAALQVQASQK